jgi:hypothetical protein
MGTNLWLEAMSPNNTKVLMSAPTCCGPPLTQIDNWSTSEASQKQLLLLVPPGQVTTGRLLVEAMYMDAPDLSHLGLGELLALLALADSYSVPKVAAFAAEALADATASGQLPWEGVLSVLGLPEACLKLPACHDVQQTAVQQLRRQLGDLEQVWADSNKSQQFLSLPPAGVQHLLASGATAVASEDTAVYSVGRWLEVHPNTTQKQVQDLAQLLRLPQCTPNYLAGLIATPGHWLHSSGVSTRDLALAACLATTCMEGLIDDEGEHPDEDDWEEECADGSTAEMGCGVDWPPEALPANGWMALHPAWSRAPRLISAITRLQLSWDIDLVQVQELHWVSQHEGVEQLTLSPEPRIWQGRTFTLALRVNSTGCRLQLMVKQPEGHLSAVEVRLGVACKWQRNRVGDKGRWSATVAGGCGYVGALPVVLYGADASWHQVEERLSEQCYIRQELDGQRVLQLRGQVVRVV